MSATAILYGIQAAAGLGQSIYGYQQMQEAQRREALLRAQGLPKMQTPQEYFDLYQNASRSKQFEQEKAMTQSILASNLATLQQAGSRALIGAAPAATLQAQRGMAAATERDYARQQAALEALASAQARTAALNFQAESAQYARDLLGAQAGYQAGAETMISGAETAIGAGALAAGAAKKKPAVDDSPDPKSGGYFDSLGNEYSVRPGSEKNFFSTDPTAIPFDYTDLYREPRQTPEFLAPQPSSITYPQTERQQQLSAFGAPAPFDPYSAFPTSVLPIDYAKGGSITTPGKYTSDHSVEYDVKTKGGKTIATVTGDETLVFNPEQRRFLKRIIGRLFKGGPIRLRKNERKAAQETFKAFKR
jgi:hypothetical protein